MGLTLKKTMILAAVLSGFTVTATIGCGDGKTKRKSKFQRILPEKPVNAGGGGDSGGKKAPGTLDAEAQKKLEIEQRAEALWGLQQTIALADLAEGDYELSEVSTRFHYMDGKTSHVEAFSTSSVVNGVLQQTEMLGGGVQANAVDRGLKLNVLLKFTILAGAMTESTPTLFASQLNQTKLVEGFVQDLANAFEAPAQLDLLNSAGTDVASLDMVKLSDSEILMRLRVSESTAKAEGETQRRELFLKYKLTEKIQPAPEQASEQVQDDDQDQVGFGDENTDLTNSADQLSVDEQL